MSQPPTPEYRPFDQDKHLGQPPWDGPKLTAWEQAHGHDARIKCYPEYGCQVIEADAYYSGYMQALADMAEMTG
jgi:hypothetical protein